MSRARPTAGMQRGFSLVELMVALTLLALMSAVLFGALGLAGRSWDGGEAKATDISEMRQTVTFLRAQLSALYPQRMRKANETPLWFAGTEDDLRYTAALPERVQDGGVLFFRLHLDRDVTPAQLVLDRMAPDPDAITLPEFDRAERTVLAAAITKLSITYFGRDPDAADTEEPTWRARWDDTQRTPLMIRIEVTPERGRPWPVLLVEPRRSPEAGCRTWDAPRQRCLRT